MKRHRLDMVSLVFGLFFLAIAGWWAANYYLGWRIEWNVPNLGWFAAGGLILVGVLGVVASLRSDRPPTERDRRETVAADPPVDDLPASDDDPTTSSNEAATSEDPTDFR